MLQEFLFSGTTCAGFKGKMVLQPTKWRRDCGINFCVYQEFPDISVKRLFLPTFVNPVMPKRSFPSCPSTFSGQKDGSFILWGAWPQLGPVAVVVVLGWQSGLGDMPKSIFLFSNERAAVHIESQLEDVPF